MIVFKGNLNPECREYMKKIKINALHFYIINQKMIKFLII